MKIFESFVFDILYVDFMNKGRMNSVSGGECKRIVSRMLENQGKNVLLESSKHFSGSEIDQIQANAMKAACVSAWLECDWESIADELNQALKLT